MRQQQSEMRAGGFCKQKRMSPLQTGSKVWQSETISLSEISCTKSVKTAGYRGKLPESFMKVEHAEEDERGLPY